jgi:hypothetical protein
MDTVVRCANNLLGKMFFTREQLQSCRAKLENAKHHLSVVVGLLQEYVASKPYETATRAFENIPDAELYISRIDPLPRRLAPSVGDVIHNARAALDHLAYQLVPSKKTYFPIADDEAKYKDKIKRDLKGASSEVLELVHSIKPFKEGNILLWQLNRLDNVDKHQLVLATFAQTNGGVFLPIAIAELRAKEAGWPSNSLKGPHLFLGVPLKVGSTLLRVPYGVAAVYTPHFDVLLVQPGIADRIPLVPLLENKLREVERVINLFEKSS